MILATEPPDLAQNAGLVQRKYALTTEDAILPRLNSERLAWRHENQRIERREGTRTRARRFGRRNDRKIINQSPGGPIDDRVDAIVR